MLTTSDEDEVVDFAYKYGEGAVIYSSIPLDFYLGGYKPNFKDIYAPNILQFAASLVTDGYSTIQGTNNNDIVSGTANNDTLEGLDGNDTIFGFYGDDKIEGGAGADTITGGSGSDGNINLLELKYYSHNNKVKLFNYHPAITTTPIVYWYFDAIELNPCAANNDTDLPRPGGKVDYNLGWLLGFRSTNIKVYSY